MKIFTDPTFDWITYVVFFSFILLGFFRGLWQGWRTALYFFAWNFVFLGIGLVIYEFTFGDMIDMLKKYVPSKEGMNLGKILDATKDVIKPIAGAALMILIYIISTLIADFFYIFIRKYFKRKIKDTAEAGLSNWGNRFLGAGLGTITLFPVATFATSLSAAVSPETEFVKINDYFTTGASFGRINHFNKAMNTFTSAFSLISAGDAFEELSKVFSGGFNGGDVNLDNLQKNVGDLTKALNDPKLIEIISGDNVIGQIMGDDQASKDTWDHIKDSNTLAEIQKQWGKHEQIVITSKEAFTRIAHLVRENFVSDPKTATDVAIKEFLKQTGIFNFIH